MIDTQQANESAAAFADLDDQVAKSRRSVEELLERLGFEQSLMARIKDDGAFILEYTAAMRGSLSDLSDCLKLHRGELDELKGATLLALREFETNLNAQIVAVRNQKILMVQETKGLMAACADVRKFFLDNDHEKETRRLQEFIGLVHQLQTLKESGALDVIADTILKLAQPKGGPQ